MKPRSAQRLLPGERRRALAVIATAVGVALAILWPLNFSVAALEGIADRAVGWGRPWLPEPRDAVVNFGAFIPIGVVAVAVGGRSLRNVAVFAALLAAALEVCQLGLPARILSPYDPIFNVAGATASATLTRTGPVFLRWVARRGIGALWPAAIGMTLAALVFAGLQGSFAALDSWQLSHRLQIGNEATGDRPWRGEITDLVLRANGRIWTERSFSFAGRCGSDDVESRCAAPTWWQAAPPEELIESVRASGAVFVSVQASSARDAQTGPARIVSISASPEDRNLTIGQQGWDLIVRIRRRWAGTNGVRPFYRLPGVFSLPQPVQVTVAAGSDSTVISAGQHRLVDRHDISRQWWVLLLPLYEWRRTALSSLAPLPFWLLLLGPVGAVAGAAAAGRGNRAPTLAFLCVSIAVIAMVGLRAADVTVGWESAVWPPLTLWSTAELARRRMSRELPAGVAVAGARAQV